MISAFCVVVRISVNVRVDENRPVNNMKMGKEIRIYVVTHKERYEKERYYLLDFTHIKHGAKIRFFYLFFFVYFFILFLFVLLQRYNVVIL